MVAAGPSAAPAPPGADAPGMGGMPGPMEDILGACLALPLEAQGPCLDEMLDGAMVACAELPGEESAICSRRLKKVARAMRNAAPGMVGGGARPEVQAPQQAFYAPPTPAQPQAPQAIEPPAPEDDLKVLVLLPEAEMREVTIAKLAVPTVRGSGVQPHVVEVLNETAVEAASVSRKLTVIGANDINAMLGFEKQKELVGCDNMSCMSEIAGALGVDAILNVTAGKVGSTYRISATLVDTARARALVRGSVKSTNIDELIGLVEKLIPEVVKPVVR